MPRPSMAAQRKEEILDALERCILNDSLDGTSLEKLAEEAKMKRSILRHYIGNRDDIVCALSARYRQHYSAQWESVMTWLPSSNRVKALLDTLFDERNQDYIDRVIVSQSLFAQAKRLEQVRDDQFAATEESLAIIENELKREYPEADPNHVELVTRGILSNYLYAESLLPVGKYEESEKYKALCVLLLKLL